MSISSNRTAALAAALLAFMHTSALAFHFGLGNAAAAEGAKVVNKANSEYMAEGNLVIPALPSCGSNMSLFNSAPVADSFVSFQPVGHVFPPGHTFRPITPISTLMPHQRRFWASTFIPPATDGSLKSLRITTM